MKLIGTIYDINSIGTTPIGSIYLYSSSENIPGGFKICNGQAIYRTEYPKLFEIIGITYGEGDGVTTFNLPDLSNQTPSNMTYIIKVQDIASEQTTYSTEEQVIGTWIDDRPIYRKVFTVTNYTAGVDIVVNHEIENFDFAINKGGVGLRKDGKHQVISNSFSNNFDFDIFDISNVSFKYYIGRLMSGDMALTTIYLWLEYVKTTDEVGE